MPRARGNDDTRHIETPRPETPRIDERRSHTPRIEAPRTDERRSHRPRTETPRTDERRSHTPRTEAPRDKTPRRAYELRPETWTLLMVAVMRLPVGSDPGILPGSGP